jgi:hypothetical protein
MIFKCTNKKHWLYIGAELTKAGPEMTILGADLTWIHPWLHCRLIEKSKH